MQQNWQPHTFTPAEMQSGYRPPENVPLQGVTNTTVVVAMPEHPKDYIVWSMTSILMGNPFCLGLIAFYYSVKSRDQKVKGDMNGASVYGSTARCFNISVLVLSILAIVITIIAVAVTVSAAASYANRYSYNSYSRYGY